MQLSNRTIRILISVIAIPLILATAWAGGIYFLLFTEAVGLIAFIEFCGMARNKNAFPEIFIGSVAVALIIYNFYSYFIRFEILAIISIQFLLIGELFRNKESAIYDLGTTFLGIFYIGIFAGTISALREMFTQDYQMGGYLIISILAAIWICDSAAYFLGSAFGKHKLFPRVSPHKTWEGAAAGLIFAIISMIVAKSIIPDFLGWRDAVFIGLTVGTLGQTGDLIESLLKRDAGKKDSSGLIPGHGGIFDRFDSLLFTSPAVYVYFYFTGIPGWLSY